MPTLGVDTLHIQEGDAYTSDCFICPNKIIPYDFAYEILVSEKHLVVAHDFCFFHLFAVMSQHFENFGIPDLSLKERVQ